MDEKRPIDRKRDSGGQADIGTEADGAIIEMIKIGERLLILKEKSIYELMLADGIDPKRTNIELPTSIHKLIIKQGSESELVARTFLTATKLFKPEYFDNSINTDRLINLAIELIQELLIFEEEINDYLKEEDSVSKEYEDKRGKPVSYSLPSITNLETKCKTIFQKADHLEQILMEMMTVFYPKDDLKKQSHFPKLYEVLKRKYGEDDTFPQFILKSLDFMKVIRGLRNGLDHRLPTVSVKNFELQTDSSIISPTIELKTKDEKLDRVSLSTFLPNVLKNFIAIIEATFAYVADKNVKQNSLGYQVCEIPEDKRRNRNVRYAFWTALGQGGFYHQ